MSGRAGGGAARGAANAVRVRAGARLLALLLLFALLPGGVLAHARLTGTEPAAEVVLDRAPAVVRLRFDEPVAPAVLRWLLPDGRADEATSRVEGAVLELAPPPDAGRGTYLLSWRVISTDGHPVAGSLAFAVGAPSGTAPPALSGWTAPVATLVRLLAWGALVLGAGAALSGVAVGPLSPRMRRLGLAGAAMSLPLCLLALGLHGLDLAGAPLAGLSDGAVWRGAVAGPQGTGTMLAHLAGLAAFAALAAGSRAAAWVGAGLAALALGASGHGRAALPGGPGFLVAALHGGAVVVWLGGLLPLLAGLGATDGAARLRRFSAFALPGVLLLLGSGLVLGLAVAPGLEAAAGSPWGALLAGKLALVAAMLGLALRNRLALLPTLAAGRPGAARALLRSIAAEAGLGLAVLVLAGGFRLTGPPAAEPALQHVHLRGEAVTAAVAIAPGRPGPVTLRIDLSTPGGGPLAVEAVAVTLVEAARGLGPIRAEAVRLADGGWFAGPLSLPVAGLWTLRLDIRVSDFTLLRVEESLPFGAAPP